MATTFPRREIEARTVRILRPRTWIAPEVRLLDLGDRLAVSKDWAALALPARVAIGWPLIRREVGILRRLIGLEGVPQLIASVDRNAFVMSHLEARMLYKVPKAEIPPGVFDRLLELLDRMHERGVVHLDLRQRKNILLDSNDRPVLIDFASGLHFRSRGRIFRFMRDVDRTAVLKLKNRVRPDWMKEEEKDALRNFDKMRKWWVIQKRRKNPKDVL